jgi:hypothetical protein
MTPMLHLRNGGTGPGRGAANVLRRPCKRLQGGYAAPHTGVSYPTS